MTRKLLYTALAVIALVAVLTVVLGGQVPLISPPVPGLEAAPTATAAL